MPLMAVRKVWAFMLNVMVPSVMVTAGYKLKLPGRPPMSSSPPGPPPGRKTVLGTEMDFLFTPLTAMLPESRLLTAVRLYTITLYVPLGMPASVSVAGAASKTSMYPDIIASSAGLTNWLVLFSASVLQLPLLAQVKDDPGMGVATPLMSATTLFSVPL